MIKSIRNSANSLLNLIPIRDYNENQAFVCENGSIIDMMQIVCKDLDASKEYDIDFDVLQWELLFKSYLNDLKIITMNYPVDTYAQSKYAEFLIEQTVNPVFKQELNTEHQLLSIAHKKYDEREFYLMYFSKDAEEYQKNQNRILSYLGKSNQIKEIAFSKKIQILSKISNMNTSLLNMSDVGIPKGIPDKLKYNPVLMANIQPQGNLSFRDERIIKKGDGYEACVHVYAFPNKVRFNWLLNIMAFDNTIATMDIGTANRLKTVHRISKSIEEQLSRYVDARYQTEKFNAERIYAQLREIHDSVTSMGEILKTIHIRIYMYANSLSELDERIAKIIAETESRGYQASVFLDEGMYEWQSLFLSISQQQRLPNRRSGASIPSETLAIGHPYHFASLADPLGLYFGYTKTNGTVLFDRYHKDRQRLSYCMVVMGSMGAGKSTFLKKCIKMDAIMGNYVRGFATNDEFDKLVNFLGGQMINLDGSDGFLNVLQVYRTNETSESMCFLKHISKVSTFYRFLVPEATNYDTAVLEDLLRKLYKKHMGYEEDSDRQITGLPPQQYPIFSDFLALIRNEMYADYHAKTRKSGLSDNLFDRMEQIELMISNLVSNYGPIFDGHSSISDFGNEQIVFFNIANLKQFSDNIFDAQVFSAMTLLWDNLLAIGAPQKNQYDLGKISMKDVKKFMIYMDEAHNFINARKTQAVKFLEQYERESRKYFGGFTFASQTIRDYMPEDSSATGIAAIKNLFSLAQYKMIFQQPPDSVQVLQNAFRDELPSNDIEQISKFTRGECILSITGVTSIRFKVDVTKSDLALFSGGA